MAFCSQEIEKTKLPAVLGWLGVRNDPDSFRAKTPKRSSMRSPGEDAVSKML